MSLKEKQSRRRYTVEFKEQAAKRVLSGQAVAVVAREWGVGDSLIHNWLARHRQPAGADAMQAEQKFRVCSAEVIADPA